MKDTHKAHRWGGSQRWSPQSSTTCSSSSRLRSWAPKGDRHQDLVGAVLLEESLMDQIINAEDTNLSWMFVTAAASIFISFYVCSLKLFL